MKSGSNLLETKCGVTLPVEDEKRRTFVKRWEEAHVSRSQALAILLKAPQEVSSTLYPSPANQHPPPNDDCSSVARLLCPHTTLVMQAHVQIKETTRVHLSRAVVSTLSITRASTSLPPTPLSPSTLRTNELSTVQPTRPSMEQRFQLDSSYRHRSGTTSTTCKINERKKKGQHQVTISQWQRAWAVNQGGELTLNGQRRRWP